MLTQEEFDSLSPEVQEKIRELQELEEKNKTQIERLTIEKEAAENLLTNTDFRAVRPSFSAPTPGTSAIYDRPRDASGLSNMEALVKDAANVEVNDSDFDKEVDAATKQILSRFSDEQLRMDPTAMRTALSMIARNTGSLAFKRAYQHSINVFQKAVNMKANIDSTVGQWRIDNPDLAGDKQSEDIVEFFLMKRVLPDPKNANKDLRTLIDMASDMARDYLNNLRLKGREEARAENTTTMPITLRPGRTGGTGPNGASRVQKQEEERPMTPEESAERFLAMRQKMSAKAAWSGRPS